MSRKTPSYCSGTSQQESSHTDLLGTAPGALNLFISPPPFPLDDADHPDERDLDDAMAAASLPPLPDRVLLVGRNPRSARNPRTDIGFNLSELKLY